MPGRIALKMCPDILQKIQMPSYVVAVTGSNGKTSTVEMMAHILKSNGIRVADNKEGSNQIEGVTTLMLNDCAVQGKVRNDLILPEPEERMARQSVSSVTPTQ